MLSGPDGKPIEVTEMGEHTCNGCDNCDCDSNVERIHGFEVSAPDGSAGLSINLIREKDDLGDDFLIDISSNYGPVQNSTVILLNVFGKELLHDLGKVFSAFGDALHIIADNIVDGETNDDPAIS